MALRPSSVPLRVPLLHPPESSLPAVPDPESDLVRAASPIISRLLATVFTDPSFESTVAPALVHELVDFAAACRLDYATSLVAESESDCPRSVRGECALGTDVLEDRQEEFECLTAAVPHLVAMLLAPEGDPDAPNIPTPRSYVEAITGPYSSQWQTAMDAEMASWKVKRPPGSPPVFKARYVAKGFSQRQGVEFFQTFSPTPKMTTLRVLLHVAAQRDYELHSLDFSTAFLQGSLHEENLAATPTWLHWVVSCSAHPSLFLRIDTSLPLFYVLVSFSASASGTPRHSHSLSAPPSDESVEPSGPYPELVGCLMYLMSCTLPDLAYPLSILALYVAPGRHRPEHWEAAMRRSSQGYTFSLGSGSVSWRSTRSSSVLISSCEAEIYAGAMAAQELRWLTYLLADLGERPRSSPVLYVDNKVMIALCQEHRLEHRTKRISLRYFLARELQQRG
ncbi:unnamed protein product [Closterium sp. NIES-53]